MTIEDIKKHAIEKGMPKRALDDTVQRLNADHPDGVVDDMMGRLLLAEIDEKAEFWDGVRGFLGWGRKAREERKHK